MSEWAITTLGEVCQKVMTGGTPLSNNEDFYKNGTIPWLRTKEVNFCRIRETESYISEQGLANSAAKVIPPDSVIIAMYGQGDTAGRVAINEIPLTTNQACCNLVIDKRIADYNFVYFYLKNSYRELVNAKTGSAQPNLNTQIIKDFPITLPPLQEQKEISAVLVSLDRKIENLRKQNETLEAIAQTLFKHWFVDFEFLNEDGKPYKSSGGEMVRSELGEMPAGWRVGIFADLIETIIDNRGKTPPSAESGIFLIEGNQIFCDNPFPQYAEAGKQKFVSNETYNNWFRSGHPEHLDILCATVGTLPKWCFCPKEEKVCIAQNIIALRANKTVCTAYWLRLFMNTRYFIESVIGRLLTTAQPSIKVGHMQSIEALIPDFKIVDRFSSVIKPTVEKSEMNHRQIQVLTKTRDMLLPKLMSGKLRITD